MQVQLPKPLYLLLVLVAAAGCEFAGTSQNGAAGTTAPKSSGTLTLLVVDDPQLSQAISREWVSQTELEINVKDIAEADLLRAKRLPGDAIVFPAGHLGHLAENGLIRPLDEQALSDEAFNRRDIFEQVRLREGSWASRTMAIPLGSPQLLLVYRRDIFEKLAISPPRTWDEYEQLSKRLGDRGELGDLAPAEGAEWQGTLEPLSPGWASQTLLARSAAYVAHRDQVSPLFDFATMQPLIVEPPYVRALSELAAASPQSQKRLTPDQVMEAIQSGSCAMGLAWPNPNRERSNRADSIPIGFAPIPGAREVYNFATKQFEPRQEDEQSQIPLLAISGRLGAVTDSAASTSEAQNLLMWLASPEISAVVCPRSSATTLFRASHLTQIGVWTPGLPADSAREYGAVLQSSASLPCSVSSIRLPGRTAYLQALDGAVADVLDQKAAPADALKLAAAKWESITKEIGLEKQRRANERHLGLRGLD